MKLNPEDKYTLQQIYVAYQTPTDQLRRNPELLKSIAEAFTLASGLVIEPGALLRYMFNRRKNKDWPKLGDRALKFQPPTKTLVKEDIDTLRQIYQKLTIPVDEYLFTDKFVHKLSDLFTKATGKIVGGWQLAAVMMSKRKSGEWVKSTDKTPLTAKPFSDIMEVVRKEANG